VTLTVAKEPCVTCPYRKDVPSGIWHPSEYAKLPRYDGTIAEQAFLGALGPFMCHQKDGCLCGGWLATHGPENLLALRVARDVDPSVWDYDPKTPVWASGAEAAAHGLEHIRDPREAARRKIAWLQRKQEEGPDFIEEMQR
jgi:hypothetical protein